MNIGQFLERWGTTGASLFLRSVAEMPTRLHRAEIQTELRRLADALEDALSSEANNRSRDSHTSEQVQTPDSELHDCRGRTPENPFAEPTSCGSAIVNCEETSEGKLFVSNGEYSSQVSFCPYCGYKAKVAAEVEK